MRGDGLEKITYRMIGPVRYSYGARDMAKEQGIRHLVYPRFTRTVSPHRLGEQMHVNDAYKLIRDNDMRNEQIAADVKLCIEKGRSPVVLSKYKEHTRLLYEKLREYADRASDIQIVKEYIDDGKTGTNFERPAFARMMADLR